MSRSITRLVLTSGVAITGVVAAVMTVPSYGGSTNTERGPVRGSYDAAVRLAKDLKAGHADTLYLPNGQHLHLNGLRMGADGKVNWDARVKNALYRGTESVASPLTARQKQAARTRVAAQRTLPNPPLRTSPLRRPFHAVPVDRYEMAGGCYRLQSVTSGRWLSTTGSKPAFSATQSAATPVYFKASALGQYILHAPSATDLTAHGTSTAMDAKPTAPSLWTARQGSGAGVFTFGQGTSGLAVDPDGSAVVGAAAPIRLALTSGCRAFPEADTDVAGLPFAGTSSFQQVLGYDDPHMHGMAFEFLGGDVHCGRPWSPYGAPTALTDCPDHYATNGYGAVLEDFLSGRTHHDPVGWPTFKDWPAPRSLTHEGTYYKWMERAWRAGQRMMTVLLVENNQLCEIYPLKRNSCDDMTSIRLQARDMHALQNYIDAQYGGPGWGWYRIVTNPTQARQVINEGKLAVVMGIETSIPFGCTFKYNPVTRTDTPGCDPSQIAAQLDSVHRMGVSQMELVNKFDNALSGVAGDAGETGVLVNNAQFKETHSYWAMQHCDDQNTGVHDHDQPTAPLPSQTQPAQDAIFGAIMRLFGGTGLGIAPVYPAPHHCNVRGLTQLGVDTIKGMAARHMLFDPDHMSVKARVAALNLVDQLHYQGVLSTHSWSTPDAYPRIYHEGGYVAPYAGDSTGFVAKWRTMVGDSDPRYYLGIGFGSDINGFGAQGDPRNPTAAQHPVTYPFRGLGGVTVYKQTAGQRVWDINTDGVAQYGLYPDWIQDAVNVAGADGGALRYDLAHGAEAYLEMWERAYGVAPNACTAPATAKPLRLLTGLRKGLTTWQVLLRAGQPDTRLGRQFTYCTQTRKVQLAFTSAGRLSGHRVL